MIYKKILFVSLFIAGVCIGTQSCKSAPSAPPTLTQTCCQSSDCQESGAICQGARTIEGGLCQMGTCVKEIKTCSPS